MSVPLNHVEIGEATELVVALIKSGTHFDWIPDDTDLAVEDLWYSTVTDELVSRDGSSNAIDPEDSLKRQVELWLFYPRPFRFRGLWSPPE